MFLVVENGGGHVKQACFSVLLSNIQRGFHFLWGFSFLEDVELLAMGVVRCF